MPNPQISHKHRVLGLSRYHRPSKPLAAFLWRKKMWFETTFALSVCEPWEYCVLVSIFILLWLLVLTGLFKLLPQHLSLMHKRAIYYLWGDPSPASAYAASALSASSSALSTFFSTRTRANTSTPWQPAA